MDSAALPSLTPFLDGIDRWIELAPLLPVLIALELVLSADNAVALAAITKGLSNIELQKKALNIGIFIALILRILLILTAKSILKYKSIQFVSALYLLALFFSKIFESNTNQEKENNNTKTNKPSKFISTVIFLAFTDLAFSIDSVTAAVAISDQIMLVITGALIGVLALRFTSGLFISWLEIYTRLEFAGYLAVALVAVKLIVLLLYSQLVIPEWTILIIVLILFLWGFSKKSDSYFANED